MGHEQWLKLIENLDFLMIFKASVLFVLGLTLASLLSKIIGHTLAGKLSRHHQLLIQRVIYYGLMLVFILTALGQMGFETDALLGLAGIVTVAVGFASQNASSNLVSGLFLIAERPFEIGDRVVYNNFEGEVIFIDLLSVKLRLYNNTVVRIPNELLLKNPVTNLTRFQIRRIDLRFNFEPDQDFAFIEKICLECAQNMNVLKQPIPEVFVRGYEPYGVIAQLCVFVNTEDFYVVRSDCYVKLLKAFKDNGIRVAKVPITATVSNP